MDWIIKAESYFTVVGTDINFVIYSAAFFYYCISKCFCRVVFFNLPF